MATIKDIAIRAGVSHGTVSNVLNKRGNVSAQKINLVEKAARDLGFKLNSQARQLRQGHSSRVCVLVPQIDMKHYRDLFEGISNELRTSGYEVDVCYSHNLNYYEEELLEKAVSSNPAAIVLVSSFMKNPGIFTEDIKFLFVDRRVKNVPPCSIYISFDLKKAGMDLAERCAGNGARNIAIFSSGRRFSDDKEFLDGVTDTLERHECDFQVFASDNKMGMNAAFEILFSRSPFDAVISDCMEHVEYLKTASDYASYADFPKVYTLSGKEAVPGEQIVRYVLNYKLCGKKIAKFIVKSDNDEGVPPEFLKMTNDGFYEGGFCGEKINTCGGDVKGETDSVPDRHCLAKEKINILMLSSPTSKALSYFLPDFTKKTGILVQLMEVSYDELYQCVSDSGESKAFDLIRLDMAWLSELGEKLFLPLNLVEEPFSSIRSGFSGGLPADYYQVGGMAYSLPFDPSVQILYYRKDLFQDALLKRTFYEQYKRQLTVPKTFKEFNEVARFFTRKFNPQSPTKYGTSLVYGSSVVAAADYLPRLKELGEEIPDHKGRVRVCTPKVRAALSNYLETHEYTDQVTKLWWQQAAEVFAEGNSAMDIFFANHASVMVQNQNSKVVGKVGFAAVPGGHPLLGGGVIGISKNTEKIESCKEFLKWVYNERVATAITYLGGYINHSSLTDNMDILELYPWIEGMEKAFGIGWRRENNGPGNFDEFKFEKIFGISIRSAVSGVLTVEQALEDAQRRCDEVFGGLNK